ncbi:MAG: hypothetical protein RIS85_2638 [Pseudomonadota bacterium]
MIRVLWLSALALLAICATFAQLDRAARRTPALAALVPPPFRSFAQEKLVIAEVRTAPPAQALAMARTLVQRRPMPSEHLSLLAMAEQRMGHTRNSGVLIQQAARRGWRDVLAQQAMFDIALNAGAPDEAARRFGAVWALQASDVPIEEMTRRILATPQGRKAVAQALVAESRWRGQFLGAAGAFAPVEVAQVVSDAAHQDADFECPALARTADLIAKAQKAQEAAQVRALPCKAPAKRNQGMFR